jgi:hypothetical protein
MLTALKTTQVRSFVYGITTTNVATSSGRTMALGPTQPLTEISTRNVSWR